MTCGVGHRLGMDPMLLWLWRRLVATALIRPLTWEPPYAAGAAQERPKKKKNQTLLETVCILEMIYSVKPYLSV